MNRDTLETLAAWGDQQNRETATLIDLAVAGTIDHLRGHGTARLLPARLEELANRIDRRYRDPDGAWVVTLRPPADDLVAVNPYDVLAYVREVEVVPYEEGEHDAPERIAALVTAASMPGVTLRDLANSECGKAFAAWMRERYHGIDNQSG